MLVAVFVLEAGLCAAEPGGPEAVEGGLTRQLKINRDALVQGPSEELRLNAAMELLLSRDPAARETLLSVLNDSENAVAQGAVCKALSQSRGWERLIMNKEQFVEPVVSILASSDEQQSRLAAQALLVFDFKTVRPHLEKIIDADTEEYEPKLNAIYALRVRPEIEAVAELVELREHPDKAIAATAEKELQNVLGIPVGADERTWQGVIEELRRKSRYEFMRDRLVAQSLEVNRLSSEIERWRQGYLAALDELYASRPDEPSRTSLLVKHLGSEWESVRLWAIEKVRQWRLSGKKVPDEIRSKLGELLGDSVTGVRLRTAELLGRMGDFSLSDELLARLESEQDEAVRIGLLGTLGEICYAELSLNPEGKEVEEVSVVRAETLERAGEYLSNDRAASEPKRVQRAAAVIRKLLEQKGLAQAESVKYLEMLRSRYEQEVSSGGEGVLRGELLNTMASLCGQNVACRSEAAELYKELFVEGLGEDSSAVRAASVTGLANIDKAQALELAKKNGILSDESITVGAAVIELAGTVGTAEDLQWLAGMLARNGLGESAWVAMRQIFERSSEDVLMRWVVRFEEGGDSEKIGTDGIEYLLETARAKAARNKNQEVLLFALKGLGELSSERGEFSEAAQYYGMLLEQMPAGADRDGILGRLIEVYLRAGDAAAVKQLVTNRLLEKGDLGSDDIVIAVLSGYFESAGGEESAAVFKELSSIEVAEGGQQWQGQLARWQELVGNGEQAEGPTEQEGGEGSAGEEQKAG